MKRAKQNGRVRTLTDDEIKRVWNADVPRIGPLVKLALLTAQRRDKLLTMRWSDIHADGVWTIHTQDGEKANAGSLQLPKAAIDIVQGMPRFVGNEFVFAGRGARPWDVNSKLKRRLDEQSGVSGWTIHDLREDR